jgi:hypothetical protein
MTGNFITVFTVSTFITDCDFGELPLPFYSLCGKCNNCNIFDKAANFRSGIARLFGAWGK